MFFFDFEEEKVENLMNETGIQFIKIFDLFGQYDVNLNFDHQVNIYIGENGLGKTTILNCIYYILEKRFSKLAEINFSKIQIKFSAENSTHEITLFDLEKYSSRMMQGRGYIDEEYVEHMLLDLTNNFRYNDHYDEDEIEFAVRKLSRHAGVPASVARQQITRFIRNGDLPKIIQEEKGDRKKIEKLIRSINENVKQKIIYLTTYRRIEDDFSKLMQHEERIRSTELLIRFGMSDVQNSIDKILNQIKNESIESFNKMTGVLLRQYSSGDKIDVSQANNEIEPDVLKIILDRLGAEINEQDKKAIIQLLNMRQIYQPQYAYLLDLIRKLIESYEVQKKYDDKIKNFVATCNKYLNGKKFFYNQSELSLKVQIIAEDDNNIGTIELTQLSSGEKQIVSLFSKLYLDGDSESIVIIDEPELSLSMKWQAMLLPDVMRSHNCKLLLTVTHSPFVFENEFDNDAKEMRAFITPSAKRR